MNYYIKQQILKMNTSAKFVKLLLIEYTDNQGNVTLYRYCDCDNNVTVTENGVTVTYEPYSFKIKNGEKNDTSIGNGSLTLSAVDQLWIGNIRNTRQKIFATVKDAVVYTQNGTEATEVIEEISYRLKNANWNEENIQWTMLFDEKNDIIVPCDKGNSQVTSGCA